MPNETFDQRMAVVRTGIRAVFGDRERVWVSVVVGSLIIPIYIVLEAPELTVLTWVLLVGLWVYVAAWLCVFGFMFERILEEKVAGGNDA